MMMINQKGFTLIEVVVSVGIISLSLVLLSTFVLQLNYLSSKSSGEREILDNSKIILDAVSYEVRGAESIYTPTTTQSQLSLQTKRYAGAGESDSFIDFFLCGLSVCLKKEGQNPVVLNAESVAVTGLNFATTAEAQNPTVMVILSLANKKSDGQADPKSIEEFTSTISFRKY